MKQQEQGAHIRSLPALDNPLLSAGEMKRFLGKTLPDYMIPSTFVFLEQLPLTISGKVDYGALPIPLHERPELEESFLAPQNYIEIQLTKIWERVLGRKAIGVNDNFFDLGGDSLSATRVISRIRDAFHVEIPLESLFEQPTVSGLGETIVTVIWKSKNSQHLHNSATDSTEEGELW